MTQMTLWANHIDTSTDRRPSAGLVLKAVRFAVCLLLFPGMYVYAQADPASTVEPAATASDPAAADSASARRLYRDARTAYADGDLDSAASLFDAAERAGFEDPVVFYNLGVTYFKLGRYGEAEAAFATASTVDSLAPLSYYNLGLVAKKNSEYRDAHGWFRQAYGHPQTSARLKRLSKKAVDTLPKMKRQKPALLAEAETSIADFLRFSFNAGYGQDSNIYRTPNASYVDLATTGTPTIDPVPQSGSFVPVEADAEFRWGPFENSHFALRYDFDGKIYTDKLHKNANAFRNRLSIGGRAFIPRKNGGYRYFRSHFAITRYDEDYYDRTDGQDHFIGTTNISNRFQRTRFGPQFYYHSKRGRLGYGFRGDAFLNKYDNSFTPAPGDPPLPPGSLDYLDLTHGQYQLGAHLSWDLLKNTDLRVSYDHARRDYTQRKAKDPNGIRFTDNEELGYIYNHAGARIRQKLGRNINLSFAYRYTIREDTFEGYDDYNRHAGMADIEFTSRRFAIETGLIYRMYDFPNGFAFDLPAAGEKTLDTIYAHIEATVKIRPRYRIELAALFDIVESSDPRSAYEKQQFSVGMRWTL